MGLLKASLLGIIFIIAANVGMAQELEPKRFTLNEAVDFGLKNAAEVKNAALDINAAHKDVKSVLAGGMPQINGKINFQNYLGIPVNIIQVPNPQTGELEQQQFKFGTDYSLSAGISATQMLFNPSFFIGLKASKLYVELTEKQLEQTEIETRNKIAKAYYGVLITSENLDLLNKNIETLTKIHFETNQLYINGFVEQIEVDRLELSLNNLETQIENLKRQRDLAVDLLKFQMGLNIRDSIVLTDNLATLQTDAEKLLAADFDYMDRTQYQILDLQKRLTDLNIKNIKSGYLPNANLFGSYERTAQRDEFSFFDSDKEWFKSAYWGLTINVPIFDSFKKSALSSQEQINYQKLDNLQFQLKNALTLEVFQAKTQFVNALDQLEAQQKNLQLAQKIYDTTIKKYNAGVGSSLEVNNAETTLNQTQSNYINALYDLLIAKTELQKALGKI